MRRKFYYREVVRGIFEWKGVQLGVQKDYMRVLPSECSLKFFSLGIEDMTSTASNLFFSSWA